MKKAMLAAVLLVFLASFAAAQTETNLESRIQELEERAQSAERAIDLLVPAVIIGGIFFMWAIYRISKLLREFSRTVLDMAGTHGKAINRLHGKAGAARTTYTVSAEGERMDGPMDGDTERGPG